jgi:cytosine/adenosine deaminase-related metal-dependent hydrolase
MSGMQQADLVIRNIDWLITVDPKRRVIREAGIAVRAGKFVAVGKSAEIERAWQASKAVDARGAVVTPGFIDNHLHASFQMSRGLADEANAQSFLFEHMYPYEAANTEEDVYVSSSLAAIELLRHGVTSFIDPGNYHPDATVRAVMATGLRMMTACSCFDKTKSVMGLLPASMIESTEKCLEKTEALFERYAGKYEGRLSVSASFRGMNNASDELILGLKQIADKHRAILQTHACFAYSTRDSSVSGSGMPEIERLESLGVLDERTVLVHGGWLEPHELAILARRKPNIVCSPTSSIHNGYGYINVGLHPELMALGVNVSLGSDHACSGSVDIVQEMRYVACGYKEARANPRVMPPEHAVEMATLNGARAMGMADRVGSVEVGKEADFVLFDAMQSEWQPLYNPVSNLVYSATGNTVKHVFIGGEQVVRDGKLTKIDQDAMMREVVKTAERIAGRLDMKKIVKLRWPVE